MSRRHASSDQPPSTAGTLIERATRRPARIAVLAIAAVALAAPMVAAEPADAPLAPSRADAAASPAQPPTPLTGPDDGTLEAVGQVAQLVAVGSSQNVVATASWISASITSAREAELAEARRVAEAEAARQAAEEAAKAEAARKAAEAAARAERARAASAAPAVAGGSVWDSLAACESGGNWAINTGNGYYGGLQFSLSSWRGVGGTGYPHEASRETQIAMAERLRSSGGWGHWPACSRKLGLR